MFLHTKLILDAGRKVTESLLNHDLFIFLFYILSVAYAFGSYEEYFYLSGSVAIFRCSQKIKRFSDGAKVKNTPDLIRGSMLVTTSRKPSAKTRTLCKLLSRFIASRCISRGKIGMQELLEFAEGRALIVVGEYHGNPGELSFYDDAGKLLFSIRFSDWYSEDLGSYWFPDVEPVLTGKGEIADTLESFFHFNRIESDRVGQLSPNSLVIAAGEKEIDFAGSGKSLFKFNIKGFKKY